MRCSILDADTLDSWLTDSDYESYPRDIYVDRKAGEWFIIYKDDEFADAEGVSTPKENTQDRAKVESAPRRYIQIPIPDHGDVHEYFARWLEDRGRNEGEGYHSIGGWMKDHGNSEDRADFEEYRRGCALRQVCNCLAQHGLTWDPSGKVVPIETSVESVDES